MPAAFFPGCARNARVVAYKPYHTRRAGTGAVSPATPPCRSLLEKKLLAPALRGNDRQSFTYVTTDDFKFGINRTEDLPRLRANSMNLSAV